MIDRESWGEIMHTISKNKLRTTLTGFSVFWGIFMLILLLGIGEGLMNGVTQEFGRQAQNTVTFWGGRTSKTWQGLGTERNIQLDRQDVEILRNAIPGLEYISAEYSVWSGNSQLNRGHNYAKFGINGVLPDHSKLRPMVMVAGRNINEMDEMQARKVIVLAEDARDALFKGEEAIHGWVNVNGIPFEVVGVYRFESGGGDQNASSTVYIPLSAAQKIFDAGSEVDEITFSFADGSLEGSKNAEQRGITAMAARHRFDPTDERALWVNNNVENSGMIMGIFGGIKMFLWIIGIGTIIAGIVGVSNIMLIVVQERTKEIGIRKALGAKPAKVVGQVILEAVFVTGMAGYMGLVFGVGLLELLTKAIPGSDMFRDPSVDMSVAMYAIATLVIAGALAGLFPALRAATIRPIEALRAE